MYKILNQYQILRLSDNCIIPVDNKNLDYQSYIQWLNDGNTPSPQYTDTELLANAKKDKENLIREEYESDCLSPVDVLGVTYNGGFESAIKLDAARRLVEAAGLPTVTFFDIDNNGHNLSLADALQVCIAVGASFQTKLARKQSAFNAIASALTIEEVNQIAY